MDLLDIFRNGQQTRNRAEGLAQVVRVQPGDDDADAAVRQGLADFDEALVEELGLVDADDFNVRLDLEHPGGRLDRGAGDGV